MDLQRVKQLGTYPARNIVLKGLENRRELATRLGAAVFSTLTERMALTVTGGKRDVFADAFKSEAEFLASDIPAYVESVQIAGYYAAGDGGAHLKRRIATPAPAKAWHKQSHDGAWWELSESVTSLRMFGAKTDTSDSGPALQACLDYGKPIYIDGVFTLKSALSVTSSISMYGFNRETSQLKIDSASVTRGFNCVPSSSARMIYLKDMSIFVEADMSTESVFKSDWSALGTSDPFVTRFYGERITMRAVTAGKFKRGFDLKFLHMGYLKDSMISNTVSVVGVTEADFTMEACVYLDNDETLYNTVGMHIEGCEFFGAHHGVYMRDIEGIWFQNNDIQACWKGLECYNGYRKINQYRISGNHFGVLDTSVRIWNARQVLIDNNEFSYRVGRLDTATVDMIQLDQVSDGQVRGNTIRGNYVLATIADITVRGIYITGIVGDTSSYIRVDGNGFRDLMIATYTDTNCNSILLGPTNTYNSQVFVSSEPNVYLPNNVTAGRMGSGPHQVPSGQAPALFLSNKSSAPLILNRDASDGAIALWYRGIGVLAGSITVAAAGTCVYGTTSDRRLKDKIVDLEGSGAFIDALRPRRFVMHDIEMVGFIADEFQKVSPTSVHGTPLAVDEEGNAVYQTMQASSPEVIANMVSELQSLRRRVAKLETLH